MKKGSHVGSTKVPIVITVIRDLKAIKSITMKVQKKSTKKFVCILLKIMMTLETCLFQIYEDYPSFS